MFDINQSIAAWRRQVQSTGQVEDGEAEELESHLRDAIDTYVAGGLTQEKAFDKASGEIGPIRSLAEEHGRAHERAAWKVSRSFFPGLVVNYLKIAVRGLLRKESYNWVNIGGLAVGLTACFFIAYYSVFEFSYDRNFSGTHIYRIINEGMTSSGMRVKDAGGPVPLGPTLTTEYPEIKQAARFWRAYMPTLRNGEKVFQEQKLLFTDTNVLSLFRFPLVKGSAAKAFELPNALVISEAMASKYFGNEDPVGKTLEYEGYPGGKRSFLVTGVFQNLPTNTHFDFDFLASMLAVQDVDAGWGSFKPVWTYLELPSSAAALTLEEKLPGFVEKYLAGRRDDRGLRLLLEPVSSIYLYSETSRPMKPGGNPAFLRILGLTGLLILLMSCANFIQISLAKTLTRMRDAGIRKVLGATRFQLLTQNLSEVSVSMILAIAVASLLAYGLTPMFYELTQVPLLVSFLVRADFLAIALVILMLIVLLTVYLPARFVWHLSITDGLRQRLVLSRHRIDLRKVLIGFQFFISTALILSVLVINDQLTFLRNRDIGLSVDHILAIPYSENPDAFEAQVRSLSGVEALAWSQRLPVNTLNYDGRIISVPSQPEPLQVESCFMTSDFLQTYQIPLLAGRNLNVQSKADSNKFLINETTMKVLGWNLENAVGQPMEWSDYMKGEVVGVVGDFPLESAHKRIPSMVLLSARSKDSFMRNFVSIRLVPGHEAETREAIRQTWRMLNPAGAYYEVSMPESYEQLHWTDILFGKLIFWFAAVALFIAVIGLYATASFTAERSRKEIGVRKVLGSTVIGIFVRLVRPFLLSALAMMILVIPFIFFLMNRWLETFAYHTAIHTATLVIGSALVLVTTVLATLKVTLGAALLNPVKYLRAE